MPFQWHSYSGGGTSEYNPVRDDRYSYARVYTNTSNTGYNCYSLQPSRTSDSPWSWENTGSWNPSSSASAFFPANVAMNGVHSAYMRTALAAAARNASNTSSSSPFGLAATSSSQIHVSLVRFPNIVWVAAGRAANNMLSPLLWPMFTLFLLPVMAAPIATEKATKLWAAATMSGARPGPYFAAHYVYCFMLFAVLGSVYVITGTLVGAPAFRHADPALFAALLGVWAHSQAGWAVLLATALGSPRLVSIVTYILIISISVASFLLTMLLSPWPAYLSWVPFLSYTRASVLVLQYGGDTIPVDSELAGE